jgi:hypothetical protein
MRRITISEVVHVAEEVHYECVVDNVELHWQVADCIGVDNDDDDDDAVYLKYTQSLRDNKHLSIVVDYCIETIHHCHTPMFRRCIASKLI